jgi:methylmalonyl-CoA mutase cobalamin-binding subunit
MSNNAPATNSPHHVVYVLPVVEGDELECRQHGPEEIIEVGVSMVRILAYLQAKVTRRTMPETTWKTK